MAGIESGQIDLVQLRKAMIASFSENDLRDICFEMRLEYDDLPPGGRSHRARELIILCQRSNRLPKLLDLCQARRPNIDWPDFAPAKTSIEDTAADTYADAKTGLEMIRIPAEEFKYGENKESVYLHEFRISKTPVTNAHYLRFVIKNGRDSPKPEHWEGQSRDDAQEILNHPVVNVSKDDEAYDDWAGMALPNKEILNHPVVCVSWDDAKAYADWANMELPSEQDWEKAARGTDGRIYPWGDEWVEGYCNTEEAWVHKEGKAKTTRVGLYPADANSPYGCVDMAGNVWEWTGSLSVKGETARVKRGGSFHRDKGLARTYSRFSDPPNTRLDHLGFRVARCLPPQVDTK